ncbi:sortase domain-bontaining protein [Xylanimonas sp. McL0601]|uniref:sortase domain-containing protein n=1 Tax=Xylanimonas sp. McL0601 TaxID=3414739 RepID=UPI003CEE0B77
MPRRELHRDPVRIVALVALLIGLGTAGHWAWDTFGTSWRADGQAAADLRAFTDAHPLPNAAAQLRTDVDAAPSRAPSTGVIATLWVPSWAGTHGVHGDMLDARVPIKRGVTRAVLDTGAAGVFAQAQEPGQVGNFTLAGHRRTYGDNFLHVDDLVRGDTVVVETPEAWFVYDVVVPGYLVEPDQGADVVAPAPGGLPAGGRYLTLVSCHSVTDGEWGNDHRIVVHAELVGWVGHDAGMPEQLLHSERGATGGGDRGEPPTSR